MRNTFLLLLSHLVYGILSKQPEWTKARANKTSQLHLLHKVDIRVILVNVIQTRFINNNEVLSILTFLTQVIKTMPSFKFRTAIDIYIEVIQERREWQRESCSGEREKIEERRRESCAGR